MKQYNGQYGCHLCEEEGATAEKNKLVRWWPYDASCTLRNKESLIANAVYATKHGVTTIRYTCTCTYTHTHMYMYVHVHGTCMV